MNGNMNDYITDDININLSGDKAMYPFPTDSEIFYNVSEHNPMWTDGEEDRSDHGNENAGA
jgi:hypothetical protein